MQQQRRTLPIYIAILLSLLLAGCNNGVGDFFQQLGSIFAPGEVAAPAEPVGQNDDAEAASEAETAAEEVDVYFVSPADGATVTSPFTLEMGAQGVDVEPAGDIREGAGHMHILIDTDFVPAGELIIADAQHLHFGQGQLRAELELEPGEHTLRLQLADGAHIALEGDAYRDEITVIVE